jgi:cobalt/nickel transport system permease protein
VTGEGILTRNISRFTTALESMILNEELARTRGFVQALDPRAKVLTVLLLIAVVGLSRDLWVLSTVLALVVALDLLSRISLAFFARRLMLFLPFTAVIALPALFITPGHPWLQLGDRVVVTIQGAHAAGLLLLRVLDSVLLGIFLVVTTPWNGILSALRWFRLPAMIVEILSMTYRYVFLFLHIVNAAFLARRSRSLGTLSGVEDRQWLARTLALTMTKTQHLSEEVYLAMLARGYQGEVFALSQLQFRKRDYLWVWLTLTVVGVLLWSTYR